MDPYEILGLARSASADEIKRKYRELAKRFHPDRNPNDKSAERKFKEVQAAYEVLGDADRRAQFDRFGAGGPTPDFHAWQGRGARPGRNGMHESVSVDFGDFGDLSSIFEQFFNRGGVGGAPPQSGRGRARRGGAAGAMPRGADMATQVQIGFQEAANGATREIVVSGGPGEHGERISFRVPAGVSEGQKIRIREKGQEGPGGRGDILVEIQIAPHPFFRRNGLDILLDLPLTLSEALLGARVEIPTLEGPTLLTVPAGTSSHAKLRLRGKGIHDSRSGQVGDMYVVIRIDVPRDLSPAARELVEKLAVETGQQPRRPWA
ncbi:MAG: DnaJ domain-containing protein [Phycisphaerales bacterium]|nr:DnaJ domain-containing protein [Phycisphaerales bacterium]